MEIVARPIRCHDEGDLIFGSVAVVDSSLAGLLSIGLEFDACPIDIAHANSSAVLRAVASVLGKTISTSSR